LGHKSAAYYWNTLKLKVNAFLTKIGSNSNSPMVWNLNIEKFYDEWVHSSFDSLYYFSYAYFQDPNILKSHLTIKNGIAKGTKSGKYSQFDNPTFIAYHALIQFNHFALTNNQESLKGFNHGVSYLEKLPVNSKGGILIPFDLPKKGIKQPWYSAISQGLVASCWIRKYHLTENINDLIRAKNLIEALFVPLEQGGVMRNENDKFWMEEYPSKKKSMVLNGFISAIIAVLEFTKLTNEKIWLERGRVLIKSLEFYAYQLSQPYTQLGSSFIPGLSILDSLFNNGINATRSYIQDYSV